jgi:quercetin dioxygenase-like cupin family protein
MEMEFKRSMVFNFTEIIDYQNGSVVSKQLIKCPVGNVTVFAFDKGEGLSTHSAPFDAMVQIVDGKAEIIINNESFHLESGNSIIMPANIPHAVKAVEKFKMVLTMIKG